ncbi:hypothetical protein EJ110_NYTH24110 [Nymphaea thermarum]|nr:hypothetical protein EJ110_NYTH24110 [Nymphaea thermarum]
MVNPSPYQLVHGRLTASALDHRRERAAREKEMVGRKGEILVRLRPMIFVFICLCSSSLLWSARGQVIIPSEYDGFLYKGHSIKPGSVVIEAFFDPLCPDSRDSWPYLKEIIRFYTPHRVSLIVHPFALPYHDNSFMACRALHIANKLNASATYHLLENLFKYQVGSASLTYWLAQARKEKKIQEKFYNEPTFHSSRASVVNKMTKLAAKVLGNSSLPGLESGFSDRETDIATRISFKYGCSRAVTGTPFFLVNGFVMPNPGSPIDYNGWRSILDPLVGKNKGDQASFSIL